MAFFFAYIFAYEIIGLTSTFLVHYFYVQKIDTVGGLK